MSIATSDSHYTQTHEVVQSLIQLYESWNKPEEAAKWRAKLPRVEDGEEQN